MSTNIVPKNTTPSNADAFVSAFIPQTPKKIRVRTTQTLLLRQYFIPAGTTGTVLDLVASGKILLVDFGFADVVARFATDSKMIEVQR